MLGVRHHLSTVETGALISLLATTTALLQPWAGRAHDRAALSTNAAGAGLVLAAGGFIVAAVSPGIVGIATAAILIGAGVAVSTPIAFATLASAAPEARLGQTMDAGEVGRGLGDAGGPMLVGALSPAGLAAGLVALSGALTLGALTTWQRRPSQQQEPVDSLPNRRGDGTRHFSTANSLTPGRLRYAARPRPRRNMPIALGL